MGCFSAQNNKPKLQQFVLNERQLKVFLNLFAIGVDGDARSVIRNKHVNQTHCIPQAVLKDLRDLVEKVYWLSSEYSAMNWNRSTGRLKNLAP